MDSSCIFLSLTKQNSGPLKVTVPARARRGALAAWPFAGACEADCTAKQWRLPVQSTSAGSGDCSRSAAHRLSQRALASFGSEFGSYCVDKMLLTYL